MFLPWPLNLIRGLISTPSEVSTKKLPTPYEMRDSVARMLIAMGNERGFNPIPGLAYQPERFTRRMFIDDTIFEFIAVHLAMRGFTMDGTLGPIIDAMGISREIMIDFEAHPTYGCVIPTEVGQKLLERNSRLAYQAQARGEPQTA